jgi:hypothetical protein
MLDKYQKEYASFYYELRTSPDLDDMWAEMRDLLNLS